MGTLPFGKKLRVSNFEVLKYTKTIDGKSLRKIRELKGITQEMRRSLTRGAVPYIKVSAISGIWSLEMPCMTGLYIYIDGQELKGGGHEPSFTEDAELNLAHIFTMWFADTSVIGDKTYMEDKAKALKSFMDRIKAPDVNKADDDKILDKEKAFTDADKNLKDKEKEERK